MVEVVEVKVEVVEKEVVVEVMEMDVEVVEVVEVEVKCTAGYVQLWSSSAPEVGWHRERAEGPSCLRINECKQRGLAFLLVNTGPTGRGMRGAGRAARGMVGWRGGQ